MMRHLFVPLFATLCAALFLQTLPLSAQKKSASPIAVEAGLDLVSRYIWRGQEYGQSPALQPSLSATWKDFTVGAWGSYKTSGAGWQETDLFISKSFGPVTLEVWDYWTFSDTLKTDFFDYKERSTSHLLEAQVLLSGGETLPLNLLGSYLFYGADPDRSIYLELQYLCSTGDTDLQFFAGYQPKGSYYGTQGSFVNVGCSVIRNLKITPSWEVPLNISLIANPNKKSLYLTAGISL